MNLIIAAKTVQLILFCDMNALSHLRASSMLMVRTGLVITAPTPFAYDKRVEVEKQAGNKWLSPHHFHLVPRMGRHTLILLLAVFLLLIVLLMLGG
jgi:hypothetical protein